MFKRFTSKTTPEGTFDEPFWTWYIDSYSRKGNEAGGPIPHNPKKYTSTSSSVVAVSKYFESLKLPVPSTYEIIALLKSPFTQGELRKTFILIRFFQMSTEGLFLTNSNQDKLGATITFHGAENWENVMCYLDALLFSMFANLESFEPVLFISNQHPNHLVEQLSALLRLYVNLLRSGNLITTDVTARICEVLMKLGFAEAMSHKQQDAVSLFQFLTETLSMPLLTFKVDIKHGGKYNKEDDLKFSKERILFVSIPDDEGIEKATEDHIEHEETDGILLEECLEYYFNNSISVMRELERRATLLRRDTGRSSYGDVIVENEEFSQPRVVQRSNSIKHELKAEHIEDLGEAPSLHREKSDSKNYVRVRTRTTSSLSIWSIGEVDGSKKPNEVSLPAWMFLRLLPFYTDDNEVNFTNETPHTYAKTSKEFVNRRPILPICLKRYSFNSSDSSTTRSKKRIIIPPIINLPQFVADEADGDAPTQFKLILESAVCHRGTSISLGHFVSVIRKDTNNTNESEEEAYNATWYLYDDMKKKSRVVEKSFKQIFKSEWPYMLFYRLVAIEGTENGHSASSSVFRSSGGTPVLPPQGSKGKYWEEDTLSPILSESHAYPNIDNLELPEPKVTLSEVSSISSIPLPDISPNDSKFVDIRNKYYWYVTDKSKDYFKEMPLRAGTSDTSSSMPPHIRRNSQWSEKSNISSINQMMSTNHNDFTTADLKEFDDELQKLTILSSQGSGNSTWQKTKHLMLSGTISPDVRTPQLVPNDSRTLKDPMPPHQEMASETSPRSSQERHHHHHLHLHESGEHRSKSKGRKIKKRRDEYKKEKCSIM